MITNNLFPQFENFCFDPSIKSLENKRDNTYNWFPTRVSCDDICLLEIFGRYVSSINLTFQSDNSRHVRTKENIDDIQKQQRKNRFQLFLDEILYILNKNEFEFSRTMI